jgi:uncharacterized protein involved in exopolysaccharide biosynthesis
VALTRARTDCEATADAKQQELKGLEEKLDALKSGGAERFRALVDESKRVEQLQQQCAALARQRDEFAGKIRDLGAMPPAELAEALHDKSPSALLHLLRKCNDELRR